MTNRVVAPYIQLRRKRLYAVLEVPRALRPQFGGRIRFVQSLGTDSISKAKVLAARIIADWKQALAVAKGEPDDAALFRQALAKARTSGNPGAIQAAQDAIEQEWQNQASPTYSSYAGGDLSLADQQEAQDVALASANDFLARAKGHRQALSPHIEGWINQAGYSGKVGQEAKAIVTAWVGNTTLADFTRKRLQDSVNSLAEAGRSIKTIRRHFGFYRSFWRYLQRMEVASHDLNPFGAVQWPKEPRKAKQDGRMAFTQEDIRKLSGAAPYPLNLLIALAAHTGCRIEELCSLKLADVHEKAPIPYIHIQGGKTAAAKRDIPLRKGVIQFIKGLRARSKDGYLFSGLEANKHGDRSNRIGRDFSDLKTKLGYDSRYVFHSLRKSLATELEGAGIVETTAAAILGHAIKTQSYGVYSTGPTLKMKADALAKFTYQEDK